MNNGLVLAIWSGAACSSFSPARRGKLGSKSGPVRNKDHPEGIPEALARREDKAKIEGGNEGVEVTVILIVRCRASKFETPVHLARVPLGHLAKH